MSKKRNTLRLPKNSSKEIDPQMMPSLEEIMATEEGQPLPEDQVEEGEPELEPETEEEINILSDPSRAQSKIIQQQDISKTIPEDVLTKIALYLEEVIAEDIKDREPWLKGVELVKPYLGFNIDQIKPHDIEMSGKKTVVNDQAKNFDTTFSTGILRMWSLIVSELLPSGGPVGYKNDVDNSDSFELAGETVKDTLNEYLTVKDKGFYPDYERFILHLLLYGCIFRKVYIDPTTQKPISRFILPTDFLMQNNCSSIYESNRFTHIRYISKREIVLSMQQGIFNSDVDLPYLNSKTEVETNAEDIVTDNLGFSEENKENQTNGLYKFYETHEYLNLKSFFNDQVDTDFNISTYQLPSPYVITRCAATNKIVSIIPNWRPDDEQKEKIDCFTHYNLFPGFNLYGLGLAHIAGNNAISLTEMQRLAIDAALFQNLPGGFKVPGIKISDNDITVGPGEWVTVDTGGVSLSEGLMRFPYDGPSPALLELSARVVQQTQDLVGTVEIGIGENSEQTPVGTTMVAHEVANRMQSSILRTIHRSFSEELQLFYKMFYVEPALGQIEHSFNIIPISDPSVESTTQRILKVEGILKIASSAPEMHNMREIYKRMYQALGIKDIDQILLPEPEENAEVEQPPMDPAIQAQMADTEQRKLEVESRERIAMMQFEADGYKNQMQIELEKAKMEQELYLAELKAQEAKELNNTKLQIEYLKLDMSSKEHTSKLSQEDKASELSAQLELLKIEARDREVSLKNNMDKLNKLRETAAPLGLGSVLPREL